MRGKWVTAGSPVSPLPRVSPCLHFELCILHSVSSVQSHAAAFADAPHSGDERAIAPDVRGEHVASLRNLFDQHPAGMRRRPCRKGEIPDLAVAFVDEVSDMKAVR